MRCGGEVSEEERRKKRENSRDPIPSKFKKLSPLDPPRRGAGQLDGDHPAHGVAHEVRRLPADGVLEGFFLEGGEREEREKVRRKKRGERRV